MEDWQLSALARALYGEGYQPGDSQDSTTADVNARYDRQQSYLNSPFGKVGGFLESLSEKLGGMPMSPSVFAAGLGLDGAKSANRWLGAAGYPEQVQTSDILAPTGAAGMLAGMGRRMTPDEVMARRLHRAAPREASAVPDLGFYRYFVHPAQQAGHRAAKIDKDELPFLSVANDRRLGALK
jgi:hypothetical protein